MVREYKHKDNNLKKPLVRGDSSERLSIHMNIPSDVAKHNWAREQTRQFLCELEKEKENKKKEKVTHFYPTCGRIKPCNVCK
jgi:hypothetical protein